MITSPIIPVWIMGIICVILLIIFRSKDTFTFIRQVIIISLIFIINLRVMCITNSAKVQNVNLDLDVVFVIDTTISMVAEDYNGKEKRLDGVRECCNYIVDELAGAKFSIIAFDNTTRKELPMTKDQELVKDRLKYLKVPTKDAARGSSLSLPKESLATSLKQCEKIDKSRQRIVFYISDGELMGERNTEIESFGDCKKYIDNGAVLGFGTTKGGKMKIQKWQDGPVDYLDYYDDSPNNYGVKDAISKIDENNLKKIANDLNVDYIKVDSKKDIKKKVEKIVKEANQSLSDESKSMYSDIYYIFVIPLAGMLVFEYINYRRKL